MNGKKIAIFIYALLLLSWPTFSIAQTGTVSGTATIQEDMDLSDAFGQPLDTVREQAGYKQSSSIEEKLGLIMNMIFALLGVIFIIFIIYSGYLWATAGGNEEKVKKAKDNIYRTTIGLIIVLTAYAISRFVLTALLPN